MLKIKKHSICACLAIVSVATWISAETLHRPKGLYAEANALYLKAQFKRALGYANEAISTDPHWLRPYGMKASIEKNIGEIESAIKDTNFIISQIRKPPRELSSGELLAAGAALNIKEEPLPALEAYAELLSRGIKTSEVLSGRAMTYEALGKNDQALADINDALSIEPNPPALYLYQRALILYNKGNYKATIQDILKTLAQNKKFPEPYVLLGHTLLKQNDSVRAVASFKKAIQLNPKDALAYLALAQTELLQKKNSAALSDFNRAVEDANGDYRPYLARAKYFLKQGNSSKALSDYQKAIDLYWISPKVAIRIGNRLRKIKKEKIALKAYSRAVKLTRCPKAPCSEIFLTSLMKRAKTYQSMKEMGSAVRDLSEAISMGPPSPLPWISRAEIENSRGQKTQALADLDQAIEIDPTNSTARLERANMYIPLRNFNAALSDFNTVIATDPANAKAYNDLGIFYANSLHKTDLALKNLLKAEALDPKTAAYQYNLGVVKFEKSDFIGALSSFNESLRLGGPPIMILTARANVYSQLGDRSNALKDIHSVLAQNPKYAPAYDIEGLMDLRENDYAGALKMFHRASDINENSFIYLIHLARAYGALGDTQKAFATFKDSFALNSHSRQALTGMCEAKRILKKPEDAIPFCDQAIALDASYAPAYLERGLAHLALQEAKATLDDLNHALILGIRLSQLHLAKAVAHTASHHYRQAHEDYEAAVHLTPIAHSPNIGFTPLRNHEDDFHSAISEVAALMVADQNNPDLLVVKGDSDANSRRFDEALTHYSRALDQSPSNPVILAARAAVYVSDHLYDAARTDMESALSANSQDASLHLQMAELLIIRKNYDGALSEALAALKLDPTSARAYFLAGNARYFQKNFQKALENYLLATKKDPENSDAYNGVGLGYFALGNYTQAVAAFSQAISLSPSATRYWRNRGSAYTKMGQYGNAAADFKSASFLNQNPNLIEDYRNLIQQSESLSSEGSTGK